jgi:uncharacterized membrane protein YeaQ/YmgE (transglycosylase-associated protein family)
MGQPSKRHAAQRERLAQAVHLLDRMTVFEFISWIFFGGIMAGIGIWLMKRRDHTAELLATGIAGGVIGGLLGLLFNAAPVSIGDYNVLSLLLSIVLASALVYAYWLARYRYRPGEPR